MKLILCVLVLLFSVRAQAGFLSGYVVGTTFSEKPTVNKDNDQNLIILPQDRGKAIIVCHKADGLEGFCQVPAREKPFLLKHFRKKS